MGQIRASSVHAYRSLARVPVRYVSVDTATRGSTALQGDTCRDREETARIAENSQLAGRFRRWWQVLGSNQRRLSRRFYSPILPSESYAVNVLSCVPRRNSGPPPSAMRPCARGRWPAEARTAASGGPAFTPRFGPFWPLTCGVQDAFSLSPSFSSLGSRSASRVPLAPVGGV